MLSQSGVIRADNFLRGVSFRALGHFAGWALHALAAVPASVPAATLPSSATTPGEHPVTGGDYLYFGVMFAWAVFAIAALLKWDVFRAKPLRTAPRRTASAFLPVACATLILYFALQIIALQAGLSLHLFSEKSLGITPATLPSITVDTSATVPATTSSQPATTAAPATAPDEVAQAAADEQTSREQMHIQIMAVGTELLTCLFVVFLCHLLTVGGLRGMGLSPDQLPRGLLLGMLGFLLIYPVLWFDNLIVINVYQQFGHEETVHETIKDIAATSDFNIRLIFALIAGIGAPIAEEFFFRGLLQTALIQRGWGFIVKFPPDREYSPPPYQRWVAILVCSIAFCALHSADHFPILFILSLALGYLYERTGNLWASITLHAAFNWSTLIFLLASGNDLVLQ